MRVHQIKHRLSYKIGPDHHSEGNKCHTPLEGLQKLKFGLEMLA
jgi:hypothetical protein